MPVYRIHVRRRKVAEQDGVLEIEAPTRGDAYLAAAFDMPEGQVLALTNWTGKLNVLEADLFVVGDSAPEEAPGEEDDDG